MRRNRSIRFRGRRPKKEPFELDITSLLDILVIMLVFLLKSYNSSGVVLNIPKGVILPVAEHAEVNTTGINIQVSSEKIWMDDEEIVDYKKEGLTRSRGPIVPLFNALTRKVNTIQQIEKTAPNARKFSGMANLILDKTLDYKFMKRIMETCAEAGLKKYKFVVLGEN